MDLLPMHNFMIYALVIWKTLVQWVMQVISRLSYFIQFSSVSQSCLTICDPMNHSTPGLPVHHSSQGLSKLMPIESVLPSNHPIFSSRLQSFPASESFPMFFASDGQNIGVSASASVLPMNIQDWFPLGFTRLISLHSKEFSRVLSNTTI